MAPDDDVGAAMGAFLAAKFSAPPLVVLALALMVAGGAGGDWPAIIAKASAAAIVAIVVVWTTYAWHVGPVTFRNGSLAGPYARGSTVIVPMARPLDVTLQLPAPEFIAALGGVLQHGVRGQPSFLAGEVKAAGGWHRYFPIVVALKWPLTLWLLAAAAIVLLATRRIALPSELLLLLSFPAVFFVLAMITNLNIGDRYVLPVYPFLLLLCAAAWQAVQGRTIAGVLVAALVVLQAADVARYAPDYLSYFNVWVPPATSYALLSDSNLDWGQGLIALAGYERAHPDATTWLAYFGGVDPSSYGIRARPLGEHDRVHGTVVVSATHLSGQYLQEPDAYHWLLGFPRTTVLDHTLHVFEVP